MKNRDTIIKLVLLVVLVGAVSYLVFVRGPLNTHSQLQKTSTSTSQSQSIIATPATAATAVKAFAIPIGGLQRAIESLAKGSSVTLGQSSVTNQGKTLTAQVTGSPANVARFFSSLTSQIQLTNNQLSGPGPLYTLTSLSLTGSSALMSAQFEVEVGT